jgi:hypothetical protein
MDNNSDMESGSKFSSTIALIILIIYFCCWVLIIQPLWGTQVIY